MWYQSISPTVVFDAIFIIELVYQNWFDEFGYIYHSVNCVAWPLSRGPTYCSSIARVGSYISTTSVIKLYLNHGASNIKRNDGRSTFFLSSYLASLWYPRKKCLMRVSSNYDWTLWWSSQTSFQFLHFHRSSWYELLKVVRFLMT